MKKLLFFPMLILMPLAAVGAQDIPSQIETLEAEIQAKQNEILALRKEYLQTNSVVEFEFEGLHYQLQIESADSVSNYTLNNDLFLILNISVTNTTESAVAFDAEKFNMYLAEVAYPNVNLIGTSMVKQAIPEFTTVEGQIHFDLTEAVSNSKDLIIRYQPSDSILVGETVYEFKVNEYKRINRDEEVVQETTPEQPIQTAQADKPTTEIETPDELSQEEIYSAIEDAYYNDLQNDYYNAPENVYYEEQPEAWEDGPGYEEYWGSSTPQFEGQLSPEEMADLD